MTKAIIAMLLGALVVPCHAATLLVDCEGGGDFPTIQEAIDAASAGDTLLVAPCVYEEHITSTDKPLSIIGSGAETTLLEWGGTETIAEIVQSSGAVSSRIADMSIRRLGAGGRGVSIAWCGRLYLERCDIGGSLHGRGYWHDYGAVSLQATDCSMEAIDLRGGGWSYTTRCTFTEAEVVGWSDYMNSALQRLIPTSCSGDTIRVGSTALLQASNCEFGGVWLYGGFHAWPSVRAEDSSLGHVRLVDWCESVDIHDCELLSFSYETEESDAGGLFEIVGCTVQGPIVLHVEDIGARIEHNTIMGDFEYLGFWWSSPNKFRSNVVVGHAAIETAGPLVISHNDFVAGAHIVAGGASVTANIEADPLFCDSPEDLSLQLCSPGVGAAHDGTDIGARGVGCECSTPAEETSWGAVKSRFRQPSN